MSDIIRGKLKRIEEQNKICSIYPFFVLQMTPFTATTNCNVVVLTLPVVLGVSPHIHQHLGEFLKAMLGTKINIKKQGSWGVFPSEPFCIHM